MTYAIIERKVKYARLEFKNGEIFAIVPRGRSHLAEPMIRKYRPWIEKNLAKYQSLKQAAGSVELKSRTLAELSSLINQYIEKASKLINKQPRQITYRTMKRRWGSCSISNDLVFNKNLAYVPDDLIWYVVFHEMCHMLVHAHNKEFNRLMRTQFEGVREAKQLLRSYSVAIESAKIP